MLTEEEETQLANTMLLIDVIEQGIKTAKETTELRASLHELKGFVDSIWKTLTEEEKNQALDRYKKERNSGDLETLPPIL